MADHPAANTLRSAIRLFESEKDQQAMSCLRHAETLLANTTGSAAAAVDGALKAYGQGNDRLALSWTRTALERVA